MTNVIQSVKKQIIPLCLAFNLVTWILGAYFEMPFLLSWPVTGFLCVFFFIVCNYVKDKGKWSVIYSLVILFVLYIIVLGINNLAASIQGIPYFFWLSGIESWEDAQSLYIVTTIIVLCAFYSSSIYYFTINRVRLYMIIVLSLIAAIVVSWVKTNIIDIHFILFILLFLPIYIEYVHYEPYVRKHQNYKAYLQAVFLFTGVVCALSFIMPKPDIGIENNLFEELYNRYFRAAEVFNASFLNDESSVGTISSRRSERIVFRIKADHPLYLRIQTWDNYESNKWKIGNEKLNMDYQLTDRRKNDLRILNGKTLDLLTLLETADKDRLPDNLKDYVKTLEQYPIFMVNSVHNAHILTADYPLQSFTTVPGTFNVTPERKDKIYYNNRLIVSLKDRQMLSAFEKYKITYYDHLLTPKERSFEFITTLDKDSYIQLLDFMEHEITDETVKERVEAYKGELAEAYNNYTSLPKSITKRTYRLAQTITEGLTSDYAKAKAIEEFFYKEGYLYDMEAPILKGKRDYLDYFLFRSKRGVCVQFASAMVVLARANGLPARYVTGYRCIEYDEEKQEYIVREKHGHAYPEIYISGYGWMVFEPTRVPDATGVIRQEEANENQGINVGKYINNNTILFTLLLLVSSFLLFIITRRLITIIGEWLWRKNVLKVPHLAAATAIFNRMLKVFEKMYLAKLTYETPDTYAKRLYKNHSIDIRSAADMFNKAYYGKIEPTQEQIQEALNKYLEICERAKKKGGSFR